MSNTRIHWMYLGELMRFMLSEEFRNSSWAVDCLFPDITKGNMGNHPLVVAERIAARKKAVLPVMIMSPLIILCGLYGVNVLGERTTDGLVYLSCLLVTYLPTFILGYSFLRFIMSAEEKQALRDCRERWAKWEQMTDQKLSDLIKRGHSSMEHIVERALVSAAKELLKIERENVVERSKGKIRSFSLEQEAAARKKFEEYHYLVRGTNLITTKKYDIYFQMAEEELKKEEAEVKA